MVEKLSAEKVIILTATPVIISKRDFQEYEKIVQSITNKEIVFKHDSKEHLVDIMNNKDLLSEEFDLSNCVTRYFKETIQCFINNDFNINNSPKRNIPKIINYTSKDDKDIQLINFIENKIDGEEINRFVIFVMTVGNEEHPLEGRKLENLFKSRGYTNCIPTNNMENISNNVNKRSYLRITGDVTERKSYIETLKQSNNNNIPTVLIITYQIGQQAINLPQYNNIINYYVSGTPESLEQRCGRIDRRGKTWNINFYNMLSKYSYDLNNINFNNAVYSFINIINYFPSKNCILTEDTLKYLKTTELIEYYIDLLRCFDNDIDDAYELLINKKEESSNSIYKFCINNEIMIDGESREEFSDYVRAMIKRKQKILIEKKESIDKIESQISNMYNKVLYIKDGILESKDTYEMAKEIERNIKPFQDKFEAECKIPIIMNRQREKIEICLENYIISKKSYILLEENFHMLTCDMMNIFNKDYDKVKPYLQKFINRLPIMQLRDEISRIIKKSLIHTYNGYMRKNKLDCKFAGHYVSTFQYIGLQLYFTSKRIDVSDRFRNILFEEYGINQEKFSFKSCYENDSIIDNLIKICMNDKRQCALIELNDKNNDILVGRGECILAYTRS